MMSQSERSSLRTEMAALEALNDEAMTVGAVVTFYTDLLNQMVELDRALITGFLESETLTEGQRLAIHMWGTSVEAIVQAAVSKHFKTGVKLL